MTPLLVSMPKPFVVCTVGLKGSGKSILSQAAAELGYQVISLGDVVKRELANTGVSPTEANVRSFSVEIRRRMGPAAVAILSDKLVRSDSSKVVFDGLRSLEEYNYFKQQYGDCVLIAIHASPRTRYMRLVSRGRSDDPKTLEEFRRRDEVELSFGIGSLLALADYHLVNEDVSEEEFKRSCLELLKKLCTQKAETPKVTPD